MAAVKVWRLAEAAAATVRTSLTMWQRTKPISIMSAEMSGPCTVVAGGNASLFGGFDDASAGGEMTFVIGPTGKANPHVERQVAGANVEAVDAGGRRYVLHVLQGLAGLDHDQA